MIDNIMIRTKHRRLFSWADVVESLVKQKSKFLSQYCDEWFHVFVVDKTIRKYTEHIIMHTGVICLLGLCYTTSASVVNRHFVSFLMVYSY